MPERRREQMPNQMPEPMPELGLEVRNLSVGIGGRILVRGFGFHLPPGRILGLRGPSGVGKTTLARALAGLHPLAGGQVLLNGSPLPGRGVRPVQYLHQNAQAAMNPRWRIGSILAEAGVPDPALLADLGVGAEWGADWPQRFPHELSGGQLQRVAVLRALMARPRCLIADEITAPLDPISQARLWRHLTLIAARERIGILAISHDAALLARICTGPVLALD